MSSLWHPFAAMGQVSGNELMMERGDGCHLWDTDGRRYLDGTAALWFNNVGYGRREIVSAARAQMERLSTFHIFGEYSNQPAEQLAYRIAAVAPTPNSKVFFGSGGSDAVDSAGKLARRYFHLIGQPQRTVFIFRSWAYHGMHVMGTAVAGMDANREGYGPLMGDVVSVPHDSVDALADVIDEVGADRIAGMFSEPVIGAGGVRPVEASVLKESRRLIDEAGALYIADEVITGFGRCGDWFASNRFSLTPDIITFAKGVTSGYLPLGGLIVAPHIAEVFWDADSPAWRHGYTYSGHATVCAAGLANLDILDDEALPSRALMLEPALTEALQPLLDLTAVSEVRSGVGLMAAVQLDPALVAANPDLPQEVVGAIRERGVITRAIGGGGLQVSPPLVVTMEQVDELVDAFSAGITAIVP